MLKKSILILLFLIIWARRQIKLIFELGFLKIYFFSYTVVLILRINCFASLGDKIENKLRKADFT